jgi:hydroxymethylpyrimidine pyrophosphatase-like HAD family hydrolase
VTSTGTHTSLPPLLLATDLDGTFAGGADQDRHVLYAKLIARPHCSLCYATGRHLESARALQDVFHLPAPDIFIADVGVTVAAGEPGRTLDFPDDELVARWPGPDAIMQHLAGLESVLDRQRLPTDRRLSFFIRDGHTLTEALDQARVALTDLEVVVVGSAGMYLDVLPRGVNKGSTLQRVIEWLGADPGSVVVAGDSLNDLALFQTGFKGIVVGNAEAPLRETVGELDHVYCARREGAGGVQEGLQHFGFLDDGQ